MVHKRSLCVLFLLLFTVNVWATPLLSGLGLIHVHSAKVLPKGYFDLYTGTRYFGKIASFGGGNSAYTLWNVQGVASFRYGASDHLEFALSPIVYQDTNRGVEGSKMSEQGINLPDDIFFSMKIGSFSQLESPAVFGGLIYARFPTAKVHNVIYESYSAGKAELGITGLFSYFSNVHFQDQGWSLHGNLGYLNHNDVGVDLTEEPLDTDPTPQTMTSELLFGFGARFPAGAFDFSAEINARYFLSRPPETAYSREYSSYLTGGVYYKPYPWLTFEMGLDLGLFNGEDLSAYAPNTSLPNPPEKFPNYPPWRGILGVKFAILPASLHTSSAKSQMQRQVQDRRDILEKMVKDSENTENAESELTRIRSERQKLEDELERLRKLLDSEKEDN